MYVRESGGGGEERERARCVDVLFEPDKRKAHP